MQEGIHPGAVCSLLRESCDLKGRISLPGAPISPVFLYACGARQGSVEGPDMWNQVLDNALREPAARWESEGIGFRLATDYRKAQKRRRGSSGEAMGALVSSSAAHSVSVYTYSIFGSAW